MNRVQLCFLGGQIPELSKSKLVRILKKLSFFELSKNVIEIRNFDCADPLDGIHYLDKQIEKLLPHGRENCLLLVVVRVPLENNFFVRPLISQNALIFTTHETYDISIISRTSVEKFLTFIILESVCAYIYITRNGRLENLVSTATHGAVFDFAKNKLDMKDGYQTRHLREESIVELRSGGFHENEISTFKNDLHKLRPGFTERWVRWSAENTVYSEILKQLFGFSMGVLASVIASRYFL